MITVRVRLFAAARDAAGRRDDLVEVASGTTLDELAALLDRRYGPTFAAVRATARLWVNADDPVTGGATVLGAGDEVAVLPPVSGGR